MKKNLSILAFGCVCMAAALAAPLGEGGGGMGTGRGMGMGGGSGRMALPAMPAGDPAQGKAVAEQVCVACHGVDGNSVAAMFPKLAGQKESYLATQLQNFRNDVRRNDLMSPFAKSLDEKAMRDVAAWYATQKLLPAGDGDTKIAAAGRALYEAGDWNRGIPACANCHDAGPGPRVREFSPLLSGQHAGYVETQLRQLQSGERGQALMMPMIAARLSEADIQAVAAYISRH